MSKTKVLDAILSMDDDSLIYKAIELIAQDYRNFNIDESCGPVSTYAIELVKNIRLDYSTSDTIDIDLYEYKHAIINADIDKMAVIAAKLCLIIDKLKEKQITSNSEE